jgi:acetate kinase
MTPKGLRDHEPGRILVVNAGSSSLKLSVLDGEDRVVLAESLPTPRGRLDESAVRDVLERGRPIGAAGHRIVHGGTEFTEPVLIDARVTRRLEALTDLAPLHQPKSLRALALVGRLLPEVPAVASFDTAFHAGLPAAAATYALPPEWRRRFELRRFGFHGLAHAYLSRRAAELLGRPAAELRIVTGQLGAGGSLAAVHGGRSVDTTMGFTPLEGLVMATRSGSVDPGLVLWLEEHVGMPPSELAATLEHRSGLLGLTGSADMRAIEAAAAGGDPAAGLALDVYAHRLRGAIAAMAAAMGGIDALVFGGGVGEHSAAVRARAADGLSFLGVALDQRANDSARPDCEVSAAGAAVRTFVVETREDLQIAGDVRQVLGLASLA